MRHPIRRLVVVGSVVGEIRIHVPNRPAIGGSVRATSNAVQAGGCFRTLGTARGLGLPVVLVGRVGDDPIGQLLRAALARIEVDTPVPPATGPHGYQVVAVENTGDLSRIEVGGVEGQLTRADIDQVPVRSDDAVLVCGSDLVSPQAGGAIAEWIVAGGLGDATLVFAPGSLALDVPETRFDAVMRRTDVLVVNRPQFALITGVTAPEDRRQAAMELVGSLAPEAMMLVRVDGEGCWLIRSDHALWFDAPAPRDTGATPECRLSAHLGVFLAEYARLEDPVEATRIATIGWTRVPGPDTPWVTTLGPGRADLDALVSSAG